MGYQYEAAEVMKCLDEGKLQSDIVPHSFSRNLMNTLDRIRDAAGIVFTGRDFSWIGFVRQGLLRFASLAIAYIVNL